MKHAYFFNTVIYVLIPVVVILFLIVVALALKGLNDRLNNDLKNKENEKTAKVLRKEA